MDIAEFLAARLDEDEAAAKEVYGFWRADGDRRIVDDSYAAVLIQDVDERTSAYILRHDPARVLREVAAQRAIIRQYEWCRKLGEQNDQDGLAGEYQYLTYVLPNLVAVYSDHPDYKEAWKPL